MQSTKGENCTTPRLIYWVLILRQWMRIKPNILSMMLHIITSKDNFFGYWLDIRGRYSHKVKLGWVHLIFIWLSWSFGLLIIPSFRLWGNFPPFHLLGVAVSKWLEKMGLNPGEIGSGSSKRGFGVRQVRVGEVLLTGSILIIQIKRIGEIASFWKFISSADM